MRGDRLFLLGASLLSAGCVFDQAELRVRPISDPAAKFRYGGGPLAEGRAQLALGNPGIALETFRKLQREQPESADAFAGIAACYAAMGRFDLARANFEFALAYAPNDTRLLTALANSLEQLGQSEQARQIRVEAASILAAQQARPTSAAGAMTAMGVPKVASVTVKLPAATTVVKAQSRQVVIQAAVLDPGEELAKPAPKPSPRLPIQEPIAEATLIEPSAARMDVRLVGAPRLARSSLGEVALLTGAEPVWIRTPTPPVEQRAERQTIRPSTVPMREAAYRNPTAVEPRWVPLRYAAAQHPRIRLLNAARSQDLAARTRTTLLDRGWRKLTIGNAPQVRDRSLVLYSADRAGTARRLAAHFRCKAIRVQGADKVVVLLGRDSTTRRAAV